jgi:predicted phosphoserine aminotransferase
LPGPTEVRHEILQAQVRAMMGHRGPDVQALMARLQPGLQALFQTERPVLLSSSSATGLMEAAIRNGSERSVLSLVNGAFSDRFAKIAKACGREVDIVEVPWGEHITPEALENRLSKKAYDAVTVVHSETSTGVLNPVAELAEVVRGFEGVFLLVDSVTGVGGAEVQTDAWGLDFVLTGSQKAVALPPGLAFGVASAAMMERSASLEGKGVYFDLIAFTSNLEKSQTPNTPALSLMYALDVQLERILAEGMEARWARHIAMRERCVEWAEEANGLAVLAAEGFRSPTVTCLELPEGQSGPGVAAAMKERGYVIAPGYGKLKDGTIRIGHMGDHTLEELEELLGMLGEVLT